jgi:branched-chain amino acid transport system ATP-binding protein
MPDTAPLLSLDAVETHIGPYHILHGVDLVVPRGGLTMLIGRNGAGKTTTLRTIMGLWKASQGRVVFGGNDIAALHTPAIAQLGIAYVPENMGIFADLTVKENMLLAARSARNAAAMDEARLQWIFKLFPAVEKFWNHPAGKLSGGQKQMLAVSRAIVEPRELLIVDEPSKGLAPSIINNMIDAFRQLKESGVTILLVEQNINFAKRLGDSVAVMDDGRIVHAGSMAALATMCGFSAVPASCARSAEPAFDGINLRDENDSLSFATDLRKVRDVVRTVVEPVAVVNATKVEDLDGGIALYRSDAVRPMVAYGLPVPVAAADFACLNVRSANLSSFDEHNQKWLVLDDVRRDDQWYFDDTLKSRACMNIVTRHQLPLLLQGAPSFSRLVFSPAARAGEYFTVGSAEVHALAPETASASALSA